MLSGDCDSYTVHYRETTVRDIEVPKYVEEKDIPSYIEMIISGGTDFEIVKLEKHNRCDYDWKG